MGKEKEITFKRKRNNATIRDVINPPEHMILRISGASFGSIPSNIHDDSLHQRFLTEDELLKILRGMINAYKEHYIIEKRHVWFQQRGANARYSLSYLFRQEFGNDTNFKHTLAFIEYQGVIYRVPEL